MIDMNIAHWLQKSTSILVGVVLVFSMVMMTHVSYSASPVFSDIGESYARIEIEKLNEDGIINGIGNDMFNPKANITRAEIAAILVRALGLKEDPTASTHFVDVSDNAWYKGYVGGLVKAGIVQGTSSTTFSPNDKVTRQQLVVFFMRAFGLENQVTELSLQSKFTDTDEIASWALASADLASEIGFIKGLHNGDNTYRFEANAYGERQAVARLTYEFYYNKDAYLEKVTALTQAESQDQVVEEEQSPTDDKKDESDNKPSYSSIITTYRSKFSSLEASYESKLSNLADQAKSDYQKLVNGESNETAASLVDKYLSKGESLEREADNDFYALLNEFESELKKYGYDTDIIAEIESEYKSKKASSESAILSSFGF